MVYENIEEENIMFKFYSRSKNALRMHKSIHHPKDNYMNKLEMQF